VAPRVEKNMPDVPELDFGGAVAEIWHVLNYAAYHLAYVRVYQQTVALRTDPAQLRNEELAVREKLQVDVTICRAHLASFFWQIDHIFEALRIAVSRGQKENPAEETFEKWKTHLAKSEGERLRQEIGSYRNKSHEIPAIIGCTWDENGNFVRHFLPTIGGPEPQETIELNTRLQQYFEYAANIWLSFLPDGAKGEFPNNFGFCVTIPNSYVGELPPELEGIPQLQVSIEAFERGDNVQAD
jgi:hypothetical protein